MKIIIIIICAIVGGVVGGFIFQVMAQPQVLTYEEQCLKLWDDGVRGLLVEQKAELIFDEKIAPKIKEFTEMECAKWEKNFYWIPLDHKDRKVMESLGFIV